MEGFINLKTLDLSANSIENITALKCLNNLVELDLSVNEIRDISDVSQLKKLEKVIIRFKFNSRY